MFKLTEKSKIYIWGPTPEVFSGGAEVINMLAAFLKSKGINAKMFSWDMPEYYQPDFFRERYDVNCASWTEIQNEEDYVIILPECMIENPENLNYFIHGLDKVQFIIWWLSSAPTYSDLSYKTSKRKTMAALRLMKDRTLHLCESEITMRDLSYHGITHRITFQHGTNKAFVEHHVTSTKQRAVMYNGLKPGTPEFVDRLKPYMPDVTFLEVKPANWGEYISKEELCDRFYDKSMVYIDFSGFEGRELMPREACLRNCVVFLGNEGTAETFDDYPLDDYYKLNRYDNLEEVASKIYNALDNYEKHLENQWFFRNKCECEPMKWEWVTTQLFGKLYKNNE
jgi:hypothetical protein